MRHQIAGLIPPFGPAVVDNDVLVPEIAQSEFDHGPRRVEEQRLADVAAKGVPGCRQTSGQPQYSNWEGRREGGLCTPCIPSHLRHEIQSIVARGAGDDDLSLRREICECTSHQRQALKHNRRKPHDITALLHTDQDLCAQTSTVSNSRLLYISPWRKAPLKSRNRPDCLHPPRRVDIILPCHALPKTSFGGRCSRSKRSLEINKYIGPSASPTKQSNQRKGSNQQKIHPG
jgi:hypothetical protein